MEDYPFAVGAEPSLVHASLLVGDVAVIVGLLSAGMVRHGENPIEMPERAVLVIGPFVVSWLVAAFLLGAYNGATRRSVVDAAVNAAGTWLAAALLGAGLRATPFLPGGAHPSFVAVVVGTGAVGLVLWRGVFTAVVGAAGD